MVDLLSVLPSLRERPQTLCFCRDENVEKNSVRNVLCTCASRGGMASCLQMLCALIALGALWVAYSGLCLYLNYLEARKIGLPIRIIPIDHLNKPWLLVDRQITSLVRRLPGALGKNNFTRFNYRGWHEHDGLRSHDEMGEAFVLVTPSHNWLHLADPDSLMNMYRRGKDFPRWTEITKMLDVFGGPNIATASGEQWRAQRKMINSCLNEQCNVVVWSEASMLGDEMARYWATKRVVTSIEEDSRTVSLHVLTKACFGQSFAFEGHDERSVVSPAASFRFSLLTIMENALLILALGPGFFMSPWFPLPSSWRRLGEACAKFKGHMTYLYNQKLHALTAGPEERDSTLIASLVRASQKMEGGRCLTADEIYGTLFVVSFAGHDTTAHVLTYAMHLLITSPSASSFYLAANPSVQDWLSQELRRVLGDKPRDEWDYHADFPRLTRCMAILYETLRLKTPVAEVKWTGENAQSLRVGGRTLAIPAGTLIVPSYIYVQKHPRFWGPDAREWRPERWIGESGARHAGRPPVVDQHDGLGRVAGGDGDGGGGEVLLSPPSRGNFLGWSEGARDCPGKRFSQVEWVAILAALFRDWQVQPRLRENETLAEARGRVADFIYRNTDYGGLLLQLMHPERLPLVWSPRAQTRSRKLAVKHADLTLLRASTTRLPSLPSSNTGDRLTRGGDVVLKSRWSREWRSFWIRAVSSQLVLAIGNDANPVSHPRGVFSPGTFERTRAEVRVCRSGSSRPYHELNRVNAKLAILQIQQRVSVETMGYHSGLVLTFSLLFLGLATLLSGRRTRRGPATRPPLLRETIPFVSNAWQFATNKDAFLARLNEAFKTTPIVRCRIGPLTLHFVTGGDNVSALFRSSFSSDPWVLRILDKSGGYAPGDISKFARDDSGSAKQPRHPGAGAVPPEARIWYAKHSMFDEALLGRRATDAFAASFQAFFDRELAAFPVGAWAEDVRVFDFLKRGLSAAATRSVLGSRIIDSNPGFIDAFWEYERFVEPLAFGLPAWLNNPGAKARDRFRAMCLKWYRLADREFNSDDIGSHGKADWEPAFGSLVSRKLASWVKSFDFSAQSQGAAYTLFLFGLHANTIPICTWIMIELIRDPNLFRAVKEEISQVEIVDGAGSESLNHTKVMLLPLLQSVYTEVLRLHVRVLITRTSHEPATIAGYNLPRGSIVQAPTETCHLDEAVWGTPDHPASEFWGYRHVREIEARDSITGCNTKKLQFSLQDRAGSFIPFGESPVMIIPSRIRLSRDVSNEIRAQAYNEIGGGLNMCAGRNFAKHEVLLAVAIMVAKLKIEFVEWVKPGGGPSERPALDDTHFANSVACPPDRDMKVRWLRER
ncbi:hypothetical protein AAE478_002600 [Parahypoxylon ruwenzoriense]